MMKIVARGFFAIALIVLIYLSVTSPDLIQQKYSNSILAAITLVYAYLTCELLIRSDSNRSLPHPSVEFIIISSLDSDLFKNNEAFISQTDLFLNEQTKIKSGTDTNKNLVFIKLDNIGDSAAISIKLNITFERSASLGGDSTTSTSKFNCKELKRDDKIMYLLQVYDNPTENDRFHINECKLEFNDIGRNYLGRPTIKRVIPTPSAPSRDKGSVIKFN